MSKIDRINPAELAQNPRATLKTWEQFRSLVEAAHAAHPNAYAYTPTSHSPAYVCSRVRDAIKGAIAFSYPCAVDGASLQRWYHEIVVRYTTTQVLFGSRETVREIVVGESTTPETTLAFVSLSDEEFNAFALLLSSGRIQGPILIKQPNPRQLTYMGHTNVETLQRPDGGIVLI